MKTERIVVVGGGIVGLATAWTLARQRPESTITLLEKESDLARHQTGRNSGVIHSGIYYKPGSLKAMMCRAGAESIVDFAKEHGVSYEICGKLIVATEESEIPGLLKLYERGKENDIPVRLIDADEAKAIEPHVRSVKAVQVLSTGIIDYVGICRALAADATANGVAVRTGVEVTSIDREGSGYRLSTSAGDVRADVLVTCGGLQSDRLARQGGGDPGAKIVPFRGRQISCPLRGPTVL